MFHDAGADIYALCIGIAFLIMSGVAKPIGAMIGAMKRLAGHALETPIAAVERKDEIGQIANAIASAVERQGSATKRIARNVQEAVHGTPEVASNFVRIKDASAAPAGARERSARHGRRPGAARAKPAARGR